MGSMYSFLFMGAHIYWTHHLFTSLLLLYNFRLGFPFRFQPSLPFFFFFFPFFFFFTTKARLFKICKAKQSQPIREDLLMDRNEAWTLMLKKERVFEAQIQIYSS